MNICVHTSLGRQGEAEPHVFFVGGHRLIVAGIRERWLEHPHRYYEVTCDDGRRFLLRYDSARDAWELAGVYARSLFSARAAWELAGLYARSLFSARSW